MEGFPNQDLFVQVFFVKGPVTCICRYLFDPVCLVDVESFTGCIGFLSIQVSPQETPAWQDEFNVAMKKAEVLMVCPW